MPDRIARMVRSGGERTARPVMLAIAGDSAAGKTTLAAGVVAALGPQRCLSICLDDYHRYSRAEREQLGVTPLHPFSNYVDVFEQHLQLLATGQPILKPVYDHSSGDLMPPQYVTPREYVIVEGVLPLHTQLARACFDIAVYVDPPELLRRHWKLHRDLTERGYTTEQVEAELAAREPDAEQFVRPQRRYADIVVRFTPSDGGPVDGPLSADLLLRPTVAHPRLNRLLTDDTTNAVRLKIIRDDDGTPVDCIAINGLAAPEDHWLLEKALWDEIADGRELPPGLGAVAGDAVNEPLAITDLLLMRYVLQEAYQV